MNTLSTFLLEPQIRKRRDRAGVKQAARDWLKTVGWSVKMCEKGTGGRRNEETYLWLWPETAVSLRCTEDGSSLISSPSCDSIYDASLLSLEGHGPTSSPKRERKSIRPSDQSLQGARRCTVLQNKVIIIIVSPSTFLRAKQNPGMLSQML